MTIQAMLGSQELPLEDWESYIRKVFDSFDEDGSGKMDEKEFKHMLIKLQIKVAKTTIPIVFRNCDSKNSGLISFDEFWNVVFPVRHS